MAISTIKKKRPKIRQIPQNPRFLFDPAAEAAAWGPLSGIVHDALEFWRIFFNLQSSGATVAADDSTMSALLTITRAVSWVESRHGTGTGAQPARDPMQCGNPNDSWWTELTDCSGAQDRLICGPGKSNYKACQLPGAAASSSGFNAQAAITLLGNQTSGHDDSAFNPTMSYTWGFPFLLHKTNTKAGHKTYQCDSLDRDSLVAGAVAYNGKGDANYGKNIAAALDMIGSRPSGAIRAAISPPLDPQNIINKCEAAYPANQGDCNHFVKAVADSLNITLFQTDDDANAIVGRLFDASQAPSVTGWFKLADALDAKNTADSGQFIIAGLKGSEQTHPVNHGHVAVVVKGPMSPGNDCPTGYWGSLYDPPGPGQDEPLSEAWKKEDRPKVQYYATSLFGNPASAAAISYSKLTAVLDGLISSATQRLADRSSVNAAHFANKPISIEVEAGEADRYVRIKIEALNAPKQK